MTKWLFFLLVSTCVYAEGPAVSPTPSQPLVVMPPPEPTGPVVFDETFFTDMDKKRSPDEDTQVDGTGKRRYINRGFAETNMGAIQGDKQACQGAKDDPQAYAECIRGRRRARQEKLDQSELAVEKNQSKPLTNVPRVPTGGQ